MVRETLRLARKADHIGALDSDANSPTSQAERVLNQENQSVALMEWNFNHRYDVTLTPNGDDKVVLPDGTIFIDSYGSDSWRNVTALGGDDATEDRFLYDLDENVDTFTGTIKVHYKILYELDCQPVWIQKYLCARAAKAMIDPIRSPELFILLEREENTRLQEARRIDENQRDRNVFNTERGRRLKGGRYWTGWSW